MLLAAAYSRADLGVVYPIARGAAPVLVLVGASVAGRGDPSALQIAGVLLVAAGVVALRGGAAPAAGRDVLLALAVGATIAGYIVADDAGLEHAATIPYLCLVVGVPALIYAVAYAARAGSKVGADARVRREPRAPPSLDRRAAAPRRTPPRRAERAAALRAEIDARTAAVGLGMVAAFGLTLAALELADPAPVAAIREGSVVIAAAPRPPAAGRGGGSGAPRGLGRGVRGDRRRRGGLEAARDESGAQRRPSADGAERQLDPVRPAAQPGGREAQARSAVGAGRDGGEPLRRRAGRGGPRRSRGAIPPRRQNLPRDHGAIFQLIGAPQPLTAPVNLS